VSPFPDADRGTLTIRQGKGRKDRVIPIGERAPAWIDKYMQASRPLLLTGGADDSTVFLTRMGEPFDRRHLTALVRGYLIESEVGKMGRCHLFRHTVATLMLENGADIRVIQQMLGTQVSPRPSSTRGCPSTCYARSTPLPIRPRI
jgi:integrase/recombinase XerD